MGEGDWVLPATIHLGTWRSQAVWKEADLLKIPAEVLPIEYAAVLRELCLAYRLLEDHGNLKVLVIVAARMLSFVADLHCAVCCSSAPMVLGFHDTYCVTHQLKSTHSACTVAPRMAGGHALHA